MKRTTKKLSGIGLELFLRRFYGTYSEIDDKLARQLSKDGANTFASVRVRRVAWRDWRPQPRSANGTLPAPPGTPEAPSVAKPPAAATPKPAAPTRAESGTIADDAAFDPYAIGLVPVYQREGAEGLSEKLAAIGSLDNLRKMARSQQIALPSELRGSDADIEAVRAAIVNAVGKRIANRRAAAG
ncbi:MAG: hypothetical protein ACR2PI_07615 [Hyphomicrobiaceae bacterium]